LYMQMKTTYAPIKELINKLKSDGLEIPSPTNAEAYLNEVGYYKLINGYKYPFQDKNKVYNNGTTIDDIYRLYTFDRNLKSLLLKYLFIIECTIKVQMSETISQQMGLGHKQYLKTKYYRDCGSENEIKYVSCKKHIERKIEKEIKEENRNIEKYKGNEEGIPFWALANILSLGDINSLWSHMKYEYQSRIASFWGFKHPFLNSALGVLRMFRNVCAHNETVYNYKARAYKLESAPIKEILDKFHIKENDKGGNYTSGTNDLFAIFIIFKKMLGHSYFNEFIDQYLSIYNNNLTKSKINHASMQKIITELRLPINIIELKKMKV